MTPAAPPARGADPNILLVDDCREVRAVVAAMLKRRGLSCDAAASLAEAKARLGQRRYDILVVDVNLPDGSGLSALGPGLDAPLAIVMTGGDVSALPVADALRGTVETLAKPFGFSAFLGRFDAVQERWRARRDYECAGRPAAGFGRVPSRPIHPEEPSS